VRAIRCRRRTSSVGAAALYWLRGDSRRTMDVALE